MVHARGKGIPGDVSERCDWLQQCAVRASAAAARSQPVCLAAQTHTTSKHFTLGSLTPSSRCRPEGAPRQLAGLFRGTPNKRCESNPIKTRAIGPKKNVNKTPFVLILGLCDLPLSLRPHRLKTPAPMHPVTLFSLVQNRESGRCGSRCE
jgi:hypothetical protein